MTIDILLDILHEKKVQSNTMPPVGMSIPLRFFIIGRSTVLRHFYCSSWSLCNFLDHCWLRMLVQDFQMVTSAFGLVSTILCCIVGSLTVISKFSMDFCRCLRFRLMFVPWSVLIPHDQTFIFSTICSFSKNFFWLI